MPSSIGVDSIVFNSTFNTGTWNSLVTGQAIIYTQNIVGRDFLMADNVNAPEQFYQPAIFNLAVQYASTNTTTTASVIGNATTATGTLSHPAASERQGYMMNLASAAGVNIGAGIKFTNNSFFRGTIPGYNGFFFNADVYFPDVSTYSGATINNQSSGVRIFIGMTDQILNPAFSIDNPAGNRVGFSYLTTAAANNPNPNWFFSTKDNTTESRVSCGQVFYSGCNYETWMGCAPFPLNDRIFWRLDNLTSGFSTTGVATANLPIGSTAIAPVAFISSITGGIGRNMNIRHVYCHCKARIAS